MRGLLKLSGKASPPPASIPPGHTAIEAPEVLLEPLAAHLTHLAELADATETHFACYYQPVITRLGAFLQRLPAGGNDGDNVSLLDARLLAAATALQRRRGYFLPPGAEPETLALEADVWTYAVFTLSLIRGLGRELSAWQVDLFDRQGQALGAWMPWYGSMAKQGAYSYRAERIDSPAAADWTPLLSPQLLPRQGHEWLWSNRAVLRVWLDALSGLASPAVICDILAPPHKSTIPVS